MKNRVLRAITGTIAFLAVWILLSLLLSDSVTWWLALAGGLAWFVGNLFFDRDRTPR